jgi:hypothetical protein
MKKSTKITGVDSKGGRKSRTGSFVSMGVTDELAMDCQRYYMDLASGREPAGVIKRIELVMYDSEDMVELDTIESLQKQVDDLIKCIDDVSRVAENSEETDSLVNNIGLIPKWDTGIDYEKDTHVMYDGQLCLVSGLNNIPEPIPEEKLPSNQPDLKLDKEVWDCGCDNKAIVNGKCANCGGLE